MLQETKSPSLTAPKSAKKTATSGDRAKTVYLRERLYTQATDLPAHVLLLTISRSLDELHNIRPAISRQVPVVG